MIDAIHKMRKVIVREEEVIIPTYATGEPEKNPMFLENRVYQGSSGVVYPYPVIEKVEDTKQDKSYHAILLENDFLKIMILPELGGRIQMAYDKIKKRHFIYYNQVIKPALVGLTGPWISGGIEFNWPQHHRPGTFLPVDFDIEKFEDGSITVWVNETERMSRQKGMAGFTLYPDKAYLQIKGKVFNGTPFPQTFLWWANPAVAVNDQYQSVFPPDVHAVFDHGKRDVSEFPLARGVYYKVDYSKGVDISRYKNIPVPTSYMSILSEYNFLGGYEHDTRAGVLHVANHHISPGKKQWTWGNGDFGKAWDRHLTDEDGPYIELMAGVYTDNQPDFAWLQPYEEKSFEQYFMPYRELGLVKNANKDILLYMDKSGDSVDVKIMATGTFLQSRIVLRGSGGVLYETVYDLSPEHIYTHTIGHIREDQSHLCLSVYHSNGNLLLSWQPSQHPERELPQTARPALRPEEITSVEQLYLAGLHLEQYRHATYRAEDYYREALRRDPSDIRNNTALGLMLLRNGKPQESEPHFRKAVETLTQYNPNPYDGEAYFHLGIALKRQYRLKEAYDAVYKACWNAAWKDAGFYTLAQISLQQNRHWDALEEIEQSLVRNARNHKARHLKALILRKLNRTDDSIRCIEESLALDRFNYGCLYERNQIQNTSETIEDLHHLLHGQIKNYEELGLDYAAAGCYEECFDILTEGSERCVTSAMTFYYMGWCLQKMKDPVGAGEMYARAAGHAPDFCFPNRVEDVEVLDMAARFNPRDSKASYYLGNFWYDKRQYSEAICCWEESFSKDPDFPTVCRNLALAAFNKQHKPKIAQEMLERAFRLNTSDARILMELDQLYKRLGHPYQDRLDRLHQYISLVQQRDDLYLEYVTLHNLTGAYATAIQLIDQRKFHPWEGGEGKVIFQYQLARMELAKKCLGGRNYLRAVELLKQCIDFPEHLGEGKLYGAQENDIYYYLGCAYEGLYDLDQARICWEIARNGISEPAAAIFYNDQKPDKIFFQGLALLKLKKKEEAEKRFSSLIHYGEAHINDDVKLDYFAVSLPDMQIWEDDLVLRNRVHCLYMQGLGYMGLDHKETGLQYLQQAHRLDINHQGILSALQTK